jgi:ubiquitin-protein ligase
MSSQSSRRLLTRLRQDLAELQDNPYPGVAVFTDDANLRELCLVLTPPSGPWKNLALHFAVELPENWVPSSSLNLIKAPNVFGF